MFELIYLSSYSKKFNTELPMDPTTKRILDLLAETTTRKKVFSAGIK